jgi:cytochrome c oxidase subunit 3
VAIGAITLSFAAYTSAMLVRQTGATDWQHVRLPSILYANTVLLLLSSATLAAGQRRLRRGGPAAGWFVATLLLGLLFVGGQVLAWRALAAEGVFLVTGPAGAFFYVLTVLHALHVLGGVGGLGYATARLRRGGPGAAGVAGAAALYWHFVDVLWLYLLVILTLWL